MHPLKLAIGCAWLVFWIYWLASAASSKESVKSGWRPRLTGVTRDWGLLDRWRPA